VLEREPAVIGATVNLAAKTAVVQTSSSDAGPLVAAIEKAGYRAAPHEGHRIARDEGRTYRRRFVVAAFLSFYVIVISLTLSPSRASMLAAWALATPVQFYCGWPFLRAAMKAAANRVQTMDTLIAVGSLAAYGYSVLALLTGAGQAYFDTAAVIITFVLLGRWIEANARARAGNAAQLLLERAAREARVMRGSEELRMPAEDLMPGDRVVVLPGETCPADCLVVEGTSSVDVSIITGESMPVDVGVGDEVPEAARNGQGRLVLDVLRSGQDATLARIAALLDRAQASKAPIQRLADRIASVFVPAILWLAFATFMARFLFGSAGLGGAVLGAAAVLLVACPCSLGLATPVAIMASTGRASELGIFFKDAESFEALKRVSVVVFDKTGTVTRGEMRLGEVVAMPGEDAGTVLALAAACERGSEHPIARAVIEGAIARDIDIPAATGFATTVGAGIQAEIAGAVIRVGRFEGTPPDSARTVQSRGAGAASMFGVWRDGKLLGVVSVFDELREEAPHVVRFCRDIGLEVELVSGDQSATVSATAERLDVSHWVAEAQPAAKVEEIERLQAAGNTVAFVGDGLNDAPALAQADAGIALGSGTDVAIEAADVTITGRGLRSVSDATLLARKTYWVIAQNLTWAFAYNILMIPLAVVGRVSPVVAAAAMACSSITVVVNALRLRRFRGSSRESDHEEAVVQPLAPRARPTHETTTPSRRPQPAAAGATVEHASATSDEHAASLGLWGMVRQDAGRALAHVVELIGRPYQP
jgi:heavy metal translocating P-type ATPase